MKPELSVYTIAADRGDHQYAAAPEIHLKESFYLGICRVDILAKRSSLKKSSKPSVLKVIVGASLLYSCCRTGGMQYHNMVMSLIARKAD
jgi:hypothetical protein